MDSSALRRALARTSATKQALLERAFRRFESDTLSELTIAEQERIVDLAARSGIRDARQFQKLDSETLEDLAGILPCTGRRSPSVSGGGLAPEVGEVQRLERPAAVSLRSDGCDRDVDIDKEVRINAAQNVLAASRRSDISDSDLRTVVKRVDEASPTEREQLYRILGEGGTNGVQAIGRLDDLTPLTTFVKETGDNGLIIIREADDLDALKELIELPTTDAKRLGQLSVTESRQVLSIIERKGDDSLFDDQVSASNIIDISNKCTLQDTLLIVKDDKGQIRWLETNRDGNVGFDAILRKHENEILSQYPSITLGKISRNTYTRRSRIRVKTMLLRDLIPKGESDTL